MAIKIYKTTNPVVTLHTQSGTIADGAFSTISSRLTSSLPSGGHEDMPLGDFEVYIPGLSAATGTLPYIEMHVRPYSLDGINAGPAPSSTYNRIIRTVGISPVTTAQYIVIDNVPLLGDADYAIKFVLGGTSNTVITGMTLKVKPFKFG